MVRRGWIGVAGMVKAARIIPGAVRDKQASASNPRASSFVSANAGSGKTHVLVQRVIRLLLTGVAPEKILCITFTKAAAANMAERVFTTLGHWVTLDDAALDAAIVDAGVPNPDKKLREIARELFAQALETPGGLKVQTIHALCTRLLQQFPFEANVPARFAVLDERDQADMMERANLKVFLEAAAAPESTLGRALLTAMANAADVTFKDVVREACLARDHFMAWTDAAGSADAAALEVSAALGIDPADRLDDIERDIVDGPYLPRRRWLEIAAALRRRAARRTRAGGPAARCASHNRHRTGGRISLRFPHRREGGIAQTLSDEEILRSQSFSRPPVRGRIQTRHAADRKAPRRRHPRPHRGAAAYRDISGGELSRAKRTSAGCSIMTI